MSLIVNGCLKRSNKCSIGRDPIFKKIGVLKAQSNQKVGVGPWKSKLACSDYYSWSRSLSRCGSWNVAAMFCTDRISNVVSANALRPSPCCEIGQWLPINRLQPNLTSPWVDTAWSVLKAANDLCDFEKQRFGKGLFKFYVWSKKRWFPGFNQP